MARVVVASDRILPGSLENVHMKKYNENMISDVFQDMIHKMEVLNSFSEDIHLSESFKSKCIGNLQVINELVSTLLKSLNYGNKFQYWTNDFNFYATLQRDTGVKIYEDINTNLHQFESNIFDSYKISSQGIGQTDSTQLNDFYWNCDNFITFSVVEVSHPEDNELKSYIWNREAMEKICNIVNCNDCCDVDYEVVQDDNRTSSTSGCSDGIRESSDSVQSSVSVITTYFPSYKIKSQIEELLQTDLRNYYIYDSYFPYYKTLQNLHKPHFVKKEVKCEILELPDLMIIDYDLAIQKLAWHTIVDKRPGYSCFLCKVLITDKRLNEHITSSKHIRNLDKSKIWIPSLQLCATYINTYEIHCSTCLKFCYVHKMKKHIKTQQHKEGRKSALDKSDFIKYRIREALKFDSLDTKTIIKKLSSVFGRHGIQMNGEIVSCQKCNIRLSLSVENIFNHIYDEHVSDNDSCDSSDSDFSEEIYRGFVYLNRNLNSSYCSICKITLATTSENNIDQHIATYGHTAFLFQYF